MKRKRCSSCFQDFSESDFYYVDKTRSRRRGNCKWCVMKDTKQWRVDNRDRYMERKRQYERRYCRDRRVRDDLFKVKKDIRSQIATYVYKRKGESSKDILGCSHEELWAHLKNTYKKNYGKRYYKGVKVHIDHIIPLATARSDKEVRALFHYTNLQFLTAEDNMKKGASLNWSLE